MWLKINDELLLNSAKVIKFEVQQYGTDNFCINAVLQDKKEFIIFTDRSETRCKEVINEIYNAILSGKEGMELVKNKR